MDIKEIERLIKLVSDSELTEFKLEEGEMKVTLKKEKEVKMISSCSSDTISYSAGSKKGLAETSMGIPSLEKFEKTEDQSLFGEPDEVVTAPLVGTFYSAPSEDGEPYVKVGDSVKKGQVIGIVEAMKLMNEIECDYDGIVAAVLVENKQVVEYGQPLFRIAKQA